MIDLNYAESLVGKKISITYKEGVPYLYNGVDYRVGTVEYVDIDEDFEDLGYYFKLDGFKCANLNDIESIEVIE